MAVQAQYPSNLLLLNRNLEDGKNKNDSQPDHGDVCGGVLDQSHVVFNNNGVGTNPRKRSREMTPTTPTIANINTYNNISTENHQQIIHHQPQQQQHQMINIYQLQNHQQRSQQYQHNYNNNNNIVSTGLRLSFEEQQNNEQLPSLLPQDFSIQFKQQTDQLNYFIHSQTEQMRRTLAEKRQKHYRALLVAAEEATTRHIRQKQVELDYATKQNVELMGRSAQLTEEAQTWQARVEAQQAQMAQIQAQIYRTTKNKGAQYQDKEMVGLKCAGGGEAEDSESVYIDPVSERRVDSASCRMCKSRDACVVLFPCRHLCVCLGCDEVVENCPVCFLRRSASVEVYFS